MRVLGDVVARERRSDRMALRFADRTTSYRDFCTTAWKSGHALSHLGVHTGAQVALTPNPALPVVTTLFGAACLGARVTFDADADARAVLVPAGDEESVADRPGRTVVVYGDAPADPSHTHWEGVVWSENPVRPPGDQSPDEVVLESDSASLTHRAALTAAERVVADADLDAEASVALRASLADPRAVVAGVVAPLVAGGTVVLGDVTTETTAVVGGGADATIPISDMSIDG